MVKIRKMLGKADSPHIICLMRLIETQSKATIAHWCIDYTQGHILSIYEAAYPGDSRPRDALEAAKAWLAGEESAKMEQALRIVAVENETDPAKINWNC